LLELSPVPAGRRTGPPRRTSGRMGATALARWQSLTPQESSSLMLVRDYSLRLYKPKCNPFAETVGAEGLLRDDVGDVLPYLNAEFAGCMYSPNAPALTLKHDGRTVTIWPRKIVVGGCADEDEARRVLDQVCRLINDVWDRRDSIEPNHESLEELKAIDVLKLLPGTNCAACGEPACLTFALKLCAGDVSIGDCAPLLGGEYEGKRQELVAALLTRGYEVPEDLR
jgi:ArsR family metal-binding transcriptional regulator